MQLCFASGSHERKSASFMIASFALYSLFLQRNQQTRLYTRKVAEKQQKKSTKGGFGFMWKKRKGTFLSVSVPVPSCKVTQKDTTDIETSLPSVTLGFWRAVWANDSQKVQRWSQLPNGSSKDPSTKKYPTDKSPLTGTVATRSTLSDSVSFPASVYRSTA